MVCAVLEKLLSCLTSWGKPV